MTDNLKNDNSLEGFTGFGKDGNETRLEFVREFNELLCDFLAVCDDIVEKVSMSEFVTNEISLLLSSSEDELDIEIEVLDSFESVYEEFEMMVSEQYKKLMETTETELLAEIMEEAKEVLEEFEEDDTLNREFCILITAKDLLDPCSCGCDGCSDCEDEEETEE
ncbi:MAG: hypothetical protein CVU84_14390 [Firmicutes bacterium HGW-Firmicutes-1]|nr:MAG: hypothetical protein CVU84_14390 [Firmicutes bacterium HGW-Firmicutes-1]